MKSLLRTYWRQALIVALLALPFVAFAILGVVWLVQSGWLVYAVSGMAVMGITTVILGQSIRRTKKAHAIVPTQSDPGWAPMEDQAWKQVLIIASKAQEAPPQDIEGVRRLADQVVQNVAQEIHGKSDFAWAQFTLPEILFAVEQAAQNLRQSVRTRIPGSESIGIANVLVIYDFYLKNRSTALLGWYCYRMFRVISNPTNAVVQEINGLVQSRAFSSTSTLLQGWMARLFAEELGRAAINLYAGRYRVSESEAKQTIVESAPDLSAPVPIRILIAGQVNAGKSSLTNALLGSVKSSVSELPTPGSIREFRINPDDQLDIVVLDTPGLNASNTNLQAVLDQCDNIDFIIWVAQANNPARELDTVALKEIRKRINSNPRLRPPSMMLVMTHIDKISPAKEWAPPYDLDQVGNTKAANIRQALAHVAQALEFGDELLIPVALRANVPIYNLDALWSAIGTCLNDAQLTALDRELKQGGGFSLSKVFAQCREGGRFVVGKIWDDLRGAESRLRYPSSK